MELAAAFSARRDSFGKLAASRFPSPPERGGGAVSPSVPPPISLRDRQQPFPPRLPPAARAPAGYFVSADFAHMKVVLVVVATGLFASACSSSHHSRPALTTTGFLINVSLAEANRTARRFTVRTLGERPRSVSCSYQTATEPYCSIQLRNGCTVVQLYRRGRRLLARYPRKLTYCISSTSH